MDNLSKDISDNSSLITDIDEAATKRLMKHSLRQGKYQPVKVPFELQIKSPMDVLYSCTEPEIDWDEYIDRIYRYSKGSNMCFIVALILIQRTNIKLNVYNAHRLLIASITVAVKYLDDRWYSQSYYALVGGLGGGAAELNRCELQLLSLIDFEVHVSNKELQRFIIMNEFLSNARARL